MVCHLPSVPCICPGERLLYVHAGLEQIDPRDLERTISGSDDSSSDVYDSDPTTDINSDLASGTPAAATPLPQAMWPFKPSGQPCRATADA